MAGYEYLNVYTSGSTDHPKYMYQSRADSRGKVWKVLSVRGPTQYRTPGGEDERLEIVLNRNTFNASGRAVKMTAHRPAMSPPTTARRLLCRELLGYKTSMAADDHLPPDAAYPATRAERDAFAAATHYVRTHDLSTPAEAAYLNALDDARRDIFHRLVSGLLRGAPSALPSARLIDSNAPSVPDDPSLLTALTGDRLSADVAPIPAECQQVALLPYPASAVVIIVPIASVHGYDRFRPVGPGYRWETETDSLTPITHPTVLVPLLEQEGAFVDAAQAERIRDELAESVANLALATLASPVQANELDLTNDSFLAAVAGGISAADRASAFERIVTDGHPFHPSGKIRRGMTATDGLAYAPEFTSCIDLRFVAVDRTSTRETRTTDGIRLTDRLCSTFHGLEAALERALPHGRDPAEYAVIPVHPWQYYHTIQERYDQQSDGGVILLSEYSHPATPQLNLRTVVPYETDQTADGPLPHIKLAIDVQTTNVVRTLSPQAVTNGSQITDILTTIAARESFDRLGLLSESAATCYFAPGGPHLDGEAYDDARHLSGLLRMNPHAHSFVTGDTLPVVASSLIEAVPGTNRPLVCNVIEEYAAATGISDSSSAALEFIDTYAEVVIPEQLLLLCKYGIALESHLQNSLIVFDEGHPIATLVRDFGGIRVHQRRLAEQGLVVNLYPESDANADSEDDLYRKLYYALFQNHLAELVATVSAELSVDEAACWTRIRQQCEDAFQMIRTETTIHEDRLQRDKRALFEDPTVHKALTVMRLNGKRHEYVTSPVSNPLAVK